MERLTRRQLLAIMGGGFLAAACGPVKNIHLPVRPAAEAITDYQLSLLADPNSVSSGDITPLGQYLDTSINESLLGLVNGHLQTNPLEIGNFAFVVNPAYVLETVDEERFLPTVNNPSAILRSKRDSREIKAVSDRALWAMENNRLGAAVIEADKEISDKNLKVITSLLLERGVQLFIIGNEPNDPSAVWRDKPSLIYHYCSQIKRILSDFGRNIEVSLPGLAYYGDGTYLGNLLDIFLSQTGQGNFLPVDVVSDHFYGGVYDLVSRVKSMRQVIKRRGLNLKYYLTELGSPGVLTYHEEIADDTLAKSFIPAAVSLAIASGVDRIFYYSFFDSTEPRLSLVEGRDGHLTPKSSYQSFRLMAKLMARLKTISLEERGQYSRIFIEREDGIKAEVIWSNLDQNELEWGLTEKVGVFDVFGYEDRQSKENGILYLKPRPRPFLSGEPRILIH